MEQLNLQLVAGAFAFTLTGGVHDLLTKRIPNWITFPGVALGLAAQAWWFGAGGVGDGLLGVLLGLVLYVPMYAFGYMGAGDVKLLMAAGAWLGWRPCLYVAAGAVLLGAVYALFEISWRGRLVAVIRNGYSFLRSVLVPGLVVEKLRVDESRKFAFGICIALAVAALVVLDRAGRLP